MSDAWNVRKRRHGEALLKERQSSGWWESGGVARVGGAPLFSLPDMRLFFERLTVPHFDKYIFRRFLWGRVATHTSFRVPIANLKPPEGIGPQKITRGHSCEWPKRTAKKDPEVDYSLGRKLVPMKFVLHSRGADRGEPKPATRGAEGGWGGGTCSFAACLSISNLTID